MDRNVIAHALQMVAQHEGLHILDGKMVLQAGYVDAYLLANELAQLFMDKDVQIMAIVEPKHEHKFNYLDKLCHAIEEDMNIKIALEQEFKERITDHTLSGSVAQNEKDKKWINQKGDFDESN